MAELPLVQLGRAERPKRRHPEWLKVRAPFGSEVHNLRRLLTQLKLHTVCQEAICPNMGECWSHRVATFIILGDICTRGCRYCAVSKGKPDPIDWTEPERVAQAVKAMGLRHAVITSVNRDDQPDGGASVFAETVRAIRRASPSCVVELLTPDFAGSQEALEIVLDAEPEILGHNVETVPRLYRVARGGGVYQVSLQLLKRVADSGRPVISKTGLMLGLGETEAEIREVMADLLECRVQILTLGQYLRPSQWHLPVARYYHPDEFLYWKRVGEEMGFVHVESGPLVRSSYLADRQFDSFNKAR
ncbi:MAG TPA: lipoyl synthase [Acidobacteriota bacterium]|nr:lipoyl synthase [Acidobacteriota bacterium]